MRILLVNRFFGGSRIPTGRMAEDLAREFVAEGHEVIALASPGAYEGAGQERDQKTKRTREENVRALRVEMVPVPRWMPRAAAWLWFAWRATKRIPRMDWDVCLLMTDPPLLPLLAAKAKEGGQVTGIRRQSDGSAHALAAANDSGATTERRVAVWLMDLYPEALAASGRLSEKSALYRWYLNKRQRALGACDFLVCLGARQRERLGTSLTEKVRTAIVPPWDSRAEVALAEDASLQNLALYAGNLGEAHSFEEILAGASFLPMDWKIRFAVRGAKLPALKAAASKLKRPNDKGAKGQGAGVDVRGYASEEETPKLLASARVHLITMLPGWDGIVVPSKLYGCVRTGRPVLFIGPENADTACEIRKNSWGAVLPPGAPGEQVAAAILELANRPTRTAFMQSGAREIARLLCETADT